MALLFLNSDVLLVLGRVLQMNASLTPISVSGPIALTTISIGH